MNRLTGKVSSIAEMIDLIKESPEIMNQVTHWRTIPPRDAQSVPFPAELDPRIAAALADRGIFSLYTHQADAFRAAARGEHVVAVTPTASGKIMCYNLPVLNTILQDDKARALYLFPTKALETTAITVKTV